VAGTWNQTRNRTRMRIRATACRATACFFLIGLMESGRGRDFAEPREEIIWEGLDRSALRC
jgi:hypothetical protein